MLTLRWCLSGSAALAWLTSVVLIWRWAGAGFFKWRHDGAGGWFKNECRKEVLKGVHGFFLGVINGAEDMVAFGNRTFAQPAPPPLPKQPSPQQLASHRNRVRRNFFVHVTSEMLAAEDVQEAARTVPDTMEIHI